MAAGGGSGYQRSLIGGTLPFVDTRGRDHQRREAIQDILHERVTHIPIYALAFIWGVGPRVEEPGINLIRSFAYSGPLEDVKLKRP